MHHLKETEGMIELFNPSRVNSRPSAFICGSLRSEFPKIR
jgi:hypothetical protein